MMPSDPAAQARLAMYLANDRLPPEVDPASKQGKHFLYLNDKGRADAATFAPMTTQQKQIIVTLLRGGAGNDGG